MTLVGHFINGEIIVDGNNTQDVFNPANGQVSKQVALADKAMVEKAIAAAQAAFPAWRNTPPMKRAHIMFRFRELLEKNADKIVAMITEEHGKVISDARGELQRGIEVVENACGAPELLKGEHNKNAGPAIDTWSEFQPLGVVAGITPFNFPAMVPLWMYPMSLICGNTFVLKPSERDPSAPLFIAQLLHEAGLPKGVFNVVNGGKEAVDTLLTDSRIEAVSFVGSTPIAEYVYQTASHHGKRCQALGGAKNHAIVMPDADLDDAADALMGAAYGSAGERCMAISVVVAVGDDAADALVEKLGSRIKDLKVGPGTDNSSDMGPLITQQHQQRVAGYIDAGVSEGADLVCDGRNLRVANCEAGYFVGATLFDRVTAEMSIYRDEIFGPVLCVVRADSLQDAIALIDAHEYGNGTCIFTRDGESARYFSDNIKVGMVGVNVPLPVPVACHTFGGWKRSLFGDLGVYGPDAIRFNTRRKTITQRWPSSGLRAGANFAFPSTK
ncbi:CoA-acylating methylmalonate-semialdehyde dehydrogenase [Zhongshania aquimaris]|uniref:methylmalonate-semialdehyde dehydrogenase (CoA acylating) n=1 Tax=Zhongshania aquimaris TaxID=2857107 RepID=A0ABS6VWF4_9GAMM|nr:CoA-acylating methylmalonate-semialdehyde dehydrogenase [Zhongshania aquimaris]MBW2942672.1 CoA-acylating methylmalonate-semialdehyde dehydrogenase [Zhongshania aquimaris]